MAGQIVVTVGEGWQLFQATAILLNCGHAHWFTIKTDELAIETTELGLGCLRNGGLDA